MDDGFTSLVMMYPTPLVSAILAAPFLFLYFFSIKYVVLK